MAPEQPSLRPVPPFAGQHSTLGRSVVELHTWTLDTTPTERLALARLMSSDEVERASRFVFDRDRHRYIAARGKLRALLAQFLNCSPTDLQFEYGEYGKPFLKDTARPCHFNLSHSQDIAALAISRDTQLGVDVEKPRPIELEIADHYFSPAEIAALYRLPPDERNAAFFRCWTLKEAVIKGLGTGLSLDLSSFDVAFTAPAEAALLRLASDPEAPSEWTLISTEAAPDVPLALAARTNGRQLMVNRIKH